MMALPLKTMGFVLLGNLTLIVLSVLVQLFILDTYPSYLNVSVASTIFFGITIMAIYLAKTLTNRNASTRIILLTQGLALLRIVLSTIWMIALKLINEKVGTWQLVEFLMIYIFYLILDVYFLDKILRREM